MTRKTIKLSLTLTLQRDDEDSASRLVGVKCNGNDISDEIVPTDKETTEQEICLLRGPEDDGYELVLLCTN